MNAFQKTKARKKLASQRILIVGIKGPLMTRRQTEVSLDELERLIDTAGDTVVARAFVDVRRITPATYIGKMKVLPLARIAKDAEAEVVVFDEELSPVQNRNLERGLSLLVLDRTAVILDIFALRARSREGKLQVALAQLEYMAPRLTGRGHALSQQAGRIGGRGPGETALEYDRRTIRRRVTFLKRSLEEVRSHRKIHRLKREAVPLPLVSLIGYTNAGKSTLMNALTDAGVFVEDKLFATLDPTVRKFRLPSGRRILIADTVGFLKRLPHELVESFKSTFEEISYAELLLHVIDASDEEAVSHAGVVGNVLRELGLDGKPKIDVINKCDMPRSFYCPREEDITISALQGVGLKELVKRMDEMLLFDFCKATFKLPFSRGDILSSIYRLGNVRKVTYSDRGVIVDCDIHEKYIGKYGRYLEK